MKKYFYLTLVHLAMFSCKPEQTVPRIDDSFSRFQKISLDYGDSVLYFTIAENQDVEPELMQRYTWFSRDTVMTTQGQFRGRLLDGSFEVLKQSDRSLLRKGQYVMGVPDGKWIIWHTNGNIKSAYSYDKGVLHGTFLLQDEEGGPIRKGRYHQNRLDGQCEYFKGDTLFMTVRYAKGVPTDTIP